MKEENTKDVQQLSTLQEKHEALGESLAEVEARTEELMQKLEKMEGSLATYQRSRLLQGLQPQQVIRSLRNGVAYLLGRRNIKRLYSPTYKRKQASNDLKPYLRALYNEGFTKRAVKDLQEQFEMTRNRYVKQAIGQELGLFFANKPGQAAAQVALYYLQQAERSEKNPNLRRQLAIMKAECQLRTGQREKAQETLHQALQFGEHRDIYLALANTEERNSRRLFWLNKVFTLHQRQPIQFGPVVLDEPSLHYAHLSHAKAEVRKITEGPIVSVILPAYNAAERIHIAIESMLEQTWQSLELIIVDDCSTDETYDIAKAYAKEDDRITLLQTERNSGPYVARNLGLSRARGEFVTVNDADDWSHPEKLEVQVTHLLDNPGVVANTSELARLTEDFYFHRRGMRGSYIFSNMSSLLFRREEVVETLGYWDEVRFSADGEFKRRLIQAFGKEAVVDLKTGPLSLPEQSKGSLTGSTAFGYAGFFMGARKEYVDSFTDYHKRAETLYYPKGGQRPFPVPYPMLPNRKQGSRHFPVVLVANFYDMDEGRFLAIKKLIEKNKQLQLKTGLVQMYDYDVEKRKRTFHPELRQLIDGTSVEMLVYGEDVTSDLVLIHSVEAFQEKQDYVPKIDNRITAIVMDELPKVTYNGEEIRKYNLRQVLRRAMAYFPGELRVFPYEASIRKLLNRHYRRELGTITLAEEDWQLKGELLEERYQARLRDWLVYHSEE